MSQRLRLLAPAKINLHLRVGPPGADGFHPLLSWMCTVGLFDTLTLDPILAPNSSPPVTSDGDTRSGRTLSPQGSDGGDTPGSAGAVAPVVWPILRLTCDDPSLPCDSQNLIVRAGHLLAEAMQQSDRPRRSFDIAATLEKRIPAGAGLGGGSSDGARALLGLNQLWAGGLTQGELVALSAKLGSDLPFFCHDTSSICTGRGEIIRATPPPVAGWAVLILPQIHMPTRAVYKKFDQMGLGDIASLHEAPDWVAWSRLPAASLLPLLRNDLEAPAFALAPELGRLQFEVEKYAGRPVRMSGSGSSLFTLFDTEDEARTAAENFSVKFSPELRNHVTGGSKVASGVMAVELSPSVKDDINGSISAA